MPIVSIGLPVYNGAAYIAAAIESILKQTYDDFELVISDNCSTDETEDICLEFARSDERVRYSRLAANHGAAANYNRVFGLSTGTYFKWAAHDDILKPEYLTVCVDAQRRLHDTVLVYPHSEFIDGSGRVLYADRDLQQTDSKSGAIRAFQVLQSMGMAAAVFGLFDSAALRRTRLIGNFVSSDYALLLQTAMLGNIVQLDTEPLFQRRLHDAMSRWAKPSKDDVLRWFDPHARSRLTEFQRLYLEYAKSSFLIEGLDVTDRVMYAASAVAGFTSKATRVRLGRWRRTLTGRMEVDHQYGRPPTTGAGVDGSGSAE